MFPKTKPTVEIVNCRKSRHGVRLQIGSFKETGFSLDGPVFLPELLRLMDGTRSIAEIEEALHTAGFQVAGRAAGLIAKLESAKLVDLREGPEPEPSPLSEVESERYFKHRLFYGLFKTESEAERMQTALKEKDVALIGMGGIGSCMAYLLGAAGVGRLRGVDPDTIELSNLTRQVLYRTQDIGRSKVEVAGERLGEYNPSIRYSPIRREVRSAEDIQESIRGCDLAILSADTPSAIRDWMNVAGIREKVPFICTGYSSHLVVSGPLVVPGETPCLACVRGRRGRDRFAQDAVDAVNRRYQVPSFGPINQMSASLSTMEALKFLTGSHEPRIRGARYLYDPLTLSGRRVVVRRDPQCQVCGAAADG